MQFLVNELSLGPHPPIQEQVVVADFCKLLADCFAFNVGEQPVFYLADRHLYAEGTSFIGEDNARRLLDRISDREQKTALASFLSRTVTIEGGDPPFREILTGTPTRSIVPYWDIATANRIAISIPTHERWRCNELRFREVGGDQQRTLPHFATITYGTDEASVVGHREFLAKFELNDHREDHPLPLRKVSNWFLSNSQITNLRMRASRAGAAERNAIHQQIGESVAAINGYAYSPALSDLNSTRRKPRKIFHSDSRAAYLSIDFMHGTFEVLNSRGRHQGEINFEGEELESADESGGHDIRLH